MPWFFSDEHGLCKDLNCNGLSANTLLFSGATRQVSGKISLFCKKMQVSGDKLLKYEHTILMQKLRLIREGENTTTVTRKWNRTRYHYISSVARNMHSFWKKTEIFLIENHAFITAFQCIHVTELNIFATIADPKLATPNSNTAAVRLTCCRQDGKPTEKTFWMTVLHLGKMQ